MLPLDAPWRQRALAHLQQLLEEAPEKRLASVDHIAVSLSRQLEATGLAAERQLIDRLKGNLLSLPGSLNFDAWSQAWSTACTGTDCRGLKPFFWNSVAIVVPSTLIPVFIGALNGYALSLWKPRGGDTLTLAGTMEATEKARELLLKGSEIENAYLAR